MNIGTIAGLVAILVSGVCFAAVLSAFRLSSRISRKEEHEHGMD